MPETILVTGAGGQLGQEFNRLLKHSDRTVISLGSDALDITSAKAWEQAIQAYQPDIIINCAAYTQVDLAEDDQQRCFAINAQAPALISALCKERGILLVHFSTDYVFSGQPESEEIGLFGYSVEHPAQPLGVYGASKWEGEEAIRSSGCRFLIIRVSWLCGYFGKNFIKTMLRLGGERPQLQVVADQVGSPSFSRQVVEQTIALIASGATGTYHVASDGTISWFDFATEALHMAGSSCKVLPIATHEYPTRAVRPAFSKLDCRKTSQLTGIPMGTWKDHLRHLIEELTHEHH